MLDKLPKDVATIIFMQLSLKQIITIRQVNKAFKKTIDEGELVEKKKYQSHFWRILDAQEAGRRVEPTADADDQHMPLKPAHLTWKAHYQAQVKKHKTKLAKLLETAILESNTALVEELCYGGINFCDYCHPSTGETITDPLIFAIWQGEGSLLKLLVTNRPHFLATTYKNVTLLGYLSHWICQHDKSIKASRATKQTIDNIKTAKKILEEWKTQREVKENASALHVAAELGDLDKVKNLLTLNPETLEAVDIYDQTPVLLAARNGHFEVVGYLIEKGANLLARCNALRPSDQGKTAFSLSDENFFNDYEIIRRLEEQNSPHAISALTLLWLRNEYNLFSGRTNNNELLSDSFYNAISKNKKLTQLKEKTQSTLTILFDGNTSLQTKREAFAQWKNYLSGLQPLPTILKMLITFSAALVIFVLFAAIGVIAVHTSLATLLGVMFFVGIKSAVAAGVFGLGFAKFIAALNVGLGMFSGLICGIILSQATSRFGFFPKELDPQIKRMNDLMSQYLKDPERPSVQNSPR